MLEHTVATGTARHDDRHLLGEMLIHPPVDQLLPPHISRNILVSSLVRLMMKIACSADGTAKR
jgi:hypothetical protein